MRITKWLAVPATALMCVAAGCGPYNGRGGYAVSASVGTGLDIYDYDPGYWGDWHTNYSMWSPTVVYESQGHYYPNQVAHSRAVSVYQYQGRYFMPPRDNALKTTDKRFDYKHRPTAQDYKRARPRPPANSGGH